MTIWRYVGGGVGAVGGFFVGGPAGAVEGGSLGYGVGKSVDDKNAADAGGGAVDAPQDFDQSSQYGYGNFSPTAQQTMGTYWGLAGQEANQQAPQLQHVGINFGGATGDALPYAPPQPGGVGGGGFVMGDEPAQVAQAAATANAQSMAGESAGNVANAVGSVFPGFAGTTTPQPSAQAPIGATGTAPPSNPSSGIYSSGQGASGSGQPPPAQTPPPPPAPTSGTGAGAGTGTSSGAAPSSSAIPPPVKIPLAHDPYPDATGAVKTVDTTKSGIGNPFLTGGKVSLSQPGPVQQPQTMGGTGPTASAPAQPKPPPAAPPPASPPAPPPQQSPAPTQAPAIKYADPTKSGINSPAATSAPIPLSQPGPVQQPPAPIPGVKYVDTSKAGAGNPLIQSGKAPLTQAPNLSSLFPGGPQAAPPPGSGGSGEFGNPNYRQQEDTRSQSQNYLSRLESDMNGGAPTAAEAQLRRATDANIASQAAAAASAGPGNYASALRTSMMGEASANQVAAGQAAELRANEYNSARSALGQGLSSQRVADLQATGMSYDNAVKQAQLEAGQSQQQADLQVKQNALNEQGMLATMGMGQATAQSDLASRMHYEDLMAQKYANDRGLAQQASQFSQGESDKQTAAFLQAGGTFAALASDRRLKSKVAKVSSRALREMLGKLTPSEWDYIHPERHGEGRRVGVMAQDLEKSKLGKRLVRDTPEGKMVDVAQGLGATLAALADQSQRLDKLESGKRTMGAAA